MRQTLQSITLATAGRMQATVNDGGLAIIKEFDLRAALRDSAYPHADHVSVEAPVKLADWPGVGAVDVQIGRDPDRIVAECKWCTDKHGVAETLWDLLKLASLVQSGRATAGLIVAAASAKTWEQAPATALFAEREYGVHQLLDDLAYEWSWLFRSVTKARPSRLPAMIETSALNDAAIACADEPLWMLRTLTVTASGSCHLDADGVVLVEDADPVPPEIQQRLDAEEARAHRAAVDRIAEEQVAREEAARAELLPEPVRVFEDPSMSDPDKTKRLRELAESPDAELAMEAESMLRSMSMREQMKPQDEDV